METDGDLCSELRFAPPRANRAQLALQRAGMTKPGSWLFQRTLYRVDRPLHRWTKGRVTVPGMMTGVPVIMLTTTGAKSGIARTMPVAGIPDLSDGHDGVGSGGIFVMGTNYAQPKTPAWVFNLEAEPRCEVQWKDRAAQAWATSVTDADERERAWQLAASFYLGFSAYRQRINNRDVRIFRLNAPSRERGDRR